MNEIWKRRIFFIFDLGVLQRYYSFEGCGIEDCGMILFLSLLRVLVRLVSFGKDFVFIVLENESNEEVLWGV